MVLVSNRRHNFGRVNMYFIVPSLLTINLRKEDLLCHFDSRMTFRVSSNAHITEEFVSHMQAKMSPTHQEFKKTEQVVGRPRTTDHNIMDDYVKDPPNVRSVVHKPTPIFIPASEFVPGILEKR
ncbi:hypothetical protein F5878DRAFT_89657 [Lentinula raphanica]|uniref:Uncharacterized protein n=1 Tax=Lentinula raphanica TaxID=153919 RepID=A0AA38PC63_9AGAR|nr:hypothetical protein F5878DRAFT_89657 [Lentinula raphanica]